MLLGIYSVFDAKAAAFMPPFFERTDGAATRAFQNACNDESHAFFKSSEDYCLYSLGTFDDSSGRIDRPGEPRPIVQAAAMKSTGV